MKMIEQYPEDMYSVSNTLSQELQEHENVAVIDRRRSLLALYADLQLLLEKKGAPDATIAERTTFHYELPKAYDSLTTDEKARFLRENSDLLIVDTFVNEGLLVGAARMDEKRIASGRDGIHVATLNDMKGDRDSSRLYYEAKHTVVESTDTIVNSAPRKVASLVAGVLDKDFNNPVMLYEVVGMNYRTGNATSRYPFLDIGTQKFMENNGWSSELQALMAAVGMHQTAMHSAKALVQPLLIGDKELIPDVKAGFEQAFWQRRIVGTPTTEGTQYYLGYIQKSRALLEHHMKQMWGDDFSYNRMVFFATGLMKTGILGDKEKRAVRNQRRPVYQAIAVGDFAAAKAHLQHIAEDQPMLFGRISLDFLLDKAKR